MNYPLLTKYVRAKREMGFDTKQAINYAVGVALTATAIVLCIGFMVLSFSPFQIHSEMGLMSALTIALALFVDFYFLPPLLLRFDRNKNEDS